MFLKLKAVQLTLAEQSPHVPTKRLPKCLQLIHWIQNESRSETISSVLACDIVTWIIFYVFVKGVDKSTWWTVLNAFVECFWVFLQLTWLVSVCAVSSKLVPGLVCNIIRHWVVDKLKVWKVPVYSPLGWSCASNLFTEYKINREAKWLVTCLHVTCELFCIPVHSQNRFYNSKCKRHMYRRTSSKMALTWVISKVKLKMNIVMLYSQ